MFSLSFPLSLYPLSLFLSLSLSLSPLSLSKLRVSDRESRLNLKPANASSFSHQLLTVSLSLNLFQPATGMSSIVSRENDPKAQYFYSRKEKSLGLLCTKYHLYPHLSVPGSCSDFLMMIFVQFFELVQPGGCRIDRA